MADNKAQSATMKQFIKIALANNSLSIKDIAEKNERTPAAISSAINRKSMNVKTLSKILNSMGENLELKLKNGQTYIIEI